ncbi:MAG: TetR/AcrR family transcriptional regulator [Flavobacteriales bacterium]|nr:TetR/AcrR family transcriptional regulator [Flavobacteriales bacterium]
MNEDLLTRVLEKSKEVFVKYGVKSITMDDISKELGISKKTLYTVIKDKNELIEKTSFSISDGIFSTIRELLLKNLDPISELLEIENIVCDTITNFDPSVIHQFQKYYPAIHKKLHDRQKSAIINMIKDNMQRGINDGLYRVDLDVNFMAHLDYSSSFNLINSDFFPANEFEIRKIKHQYLIYHLRGISSSKGLSFIESKLTDY